MTREEEIKKQADIYTDDASNYTEWSDDGCWSDKNDIELVKKAFIEGAKWADKTMIEKACKWLEQHQEDYNMYDAWCGDYVNFKSLIIDFSKAMDE